MEIKCDNTHSMLSRFSLRVLIVAEIVLAIAGSVVNTVSEPLLPSELQAYQQAASEADYTTRERVILGVSIVFGIVALVSSIGLFLCWPPARRLYLLTTMLGVLMGPMYGPYVDTGWGQLFDEAAMVVAGVVLALVYWSPLRDLYESPNTAA